MNEFIDFSVPYVLWKDADCPDNYFQEDFIQRPHDIGPLLRSCRDYMDFQVEWLVPNDQYLLSIKSVQISDERWEKLQLSYYQGLITKQVDDLEAATDHDSNMILGWLGADEPEYIDDFDAMKKVQEIINNHQGITSSKPVWYAIMGKASGRWDVGTVFNPLALTT
jgi:hypothetical protein